MFSWDGVLGGWPLDIPNAMWKKKVSKAVAVWTVGVLLAGATDWCPSV
jgi:hypothetical protein